MTPDPSGRHPKRCYFTVIVVKFTVTYCYGSCGKLVSLFHACAFIRWRGKLGNKKGRNKTRERGAVAPLLHKIFAANFYAPARPSPRRRRVLRGAKRVSGEVVDGVAEVEVVDVLAAALERAVLFEEADPLGLCWRVRRQTENVEHSAELRASDGADVGHVEVVEQRKQLHLCVLHLYERTQHTSS